MAISDDLENIQNMTTKEKLSEAKALLHYLLIEYQAVTSTGGDGVSIQRNIAELRNYIKDLEMDLSNECGDVKAINQIRINW